MQLNKDCRTMRCLNVEWRAYVGPENEPRNRMLVLRVLGEHDFRTTWPRELTD